MIRLKRLQAVSGALLFGRGPGIAREGSRISFGNPQDEIARDGFEHRAVKIPDAL